MLAGIPQMQPDLHTHLSAPIVLHLTGPGGGSWRIAPDGPDGTLTVGHPKGDSVAFVTTSAHAFVIWGTCRDAWRNHCVVEGQRQVAERFLDALNIV